MKMNLPKMLDMFTTRAGFLPSLPKRDRLFYQLTGTATGFSGYIDAGNLWSSSANLLRSDVDPDAKCNNENEGYMTF